MSQGRSRISGLRVHMYKGVCGGGGGGSLCWFYLIFFFKYLKTGDKEWGFMQTPWTPSGSATDEFLNLNSSPLALLYIWTRLWILVLITYGPWALNVTNPVFGVSDKPQLQRLAKNLISLVASLDMILSKMWIIKALMSLRICTVRSAPLLFTNPEDRFSHAKAHMQVVKTQTSLCKLAVLPDPSLLAHTG